MTTTYEVGFRLATTGTSSVVSDVGRVGKSFDDVGTDVRGLGDVVDRTGQKSKALLGDLKSYLVGLAGAFTIKEFVETADSMAMLDARLRTATATEREYVKAKEEVYRISQKNNVGIEEATQLYIKLADPVKRLGGTTKEVGGIVDAFAMSLRVGGASSQEASAATLQFAQAMGSGKLQGDEFRSMAEASPRFLKALADGMGLPVEKLKEMGTEGKLTSDVVGNALLKSISKLRDEARSLPDTVGGALTRMANDAKLAIAEINKASGMTEGIAEAISEVGKLIPLVKKELVEAFQDVSQWIQENKGHLSENWEEAKNLVGEVWGLIKIAADVAGAIGTWAGEVGLVTVSLQSARLLVAGFQDGVELIGAAFAGVGADIIRFVMVPVGDVMEKTARFVGMFDEQLAAKIRSFAQDTVAIADGARSYAEGVFQKFADGRTKVGELSDKMADAKGKADQMKVALGENSLSAADNGNEMARLGIKVGNTQAAFTSLKPAIDAGTKSKDDAAKKAASLLESYDKLSAGISAKVQAEALETDGGTKLTAVQTAYLPILNALRDGKVTYTALVGKGVIAEMENALAVEASNLARAAEVKWLQEAAKESANALAAVDKHNDSLQTQIDRLTSQATELRLGRDALDAHTTALDMDRAAQLESRAALLDAAGVTGEMSTKLREQADLIWKTIEAKDDLKHQQYIDMLERTTERLDAQVVSEKATVDALKESIEITGLSTEELGAYTLAKYNDMAAIKDRLAEMLPENEANADAKRQFEAQAAALRDLGALKTDAIHLKAAQESAAEWRKTTDSIYQGTADALLKGNLTGKTIYADLLAWTTDSFSRTVLQPAIKDILSPFLDLWKDVVGYVNESVLKPLFDDVTKPFKELVKSAFGWVNEQVLTPIVENVWKPFVKWFNDAVTEILGGTITPVVKDVWSTFKGLFGGVASSIEATPINPQLSTAGLGSWLDAFMTGLSGVMDWFGSAWNSLFSSASSGLGSLVSGLGALFGSDSSVGGAISAAGSWISGLSSGTGSTAGGGMGGVGQVGGLIGSAYQLYSGATAGTGTGIAGAIGNYVGGLLGNTTAGTLAPGVANGIGGAVSGGVHGGSVTFTNLGGTTAATGAGTAAAGTGAGAGWSGGVGAAGSGGAGLGAAGSLAVVGAAYALGSYLQSKDNGYRITGFAATDLNYNRETMSPGLDPNDLITPLPAKYVYLMDQRGPQDAAAQQILDTVAAQYQKLATAFGGVPGQLTGAVAIELNPTSPDKDNVFALDVKLNGADVYSRNDRKTGGGTVDDFGDSTAELERVVQLASSQAVLRALQATDLGADVNAQIASIGFGDAVGIQDQLVAILKARGVPGYARGGMHAGGLRIVGEVGAELEATGPARYYSASDTKKMLSGGDQAEVVGAINANGRRQAALIEALNDRIATLERVVADQGEMGRAQVASSGRLVSDTIREVAPA